MDLPQNTPGFVPRKVDDDELPFDPKTLKPRVSTKETPAVDLEAEPPKRPVPHVVETSNEGEEAASQEATDDLTEDEIAAVNSGSGSAEDTEEQPAQPTFPFTV
jgi:hypothetical protein